MPKILSTARISGILGLKRQGKSQRSASSKGRDAKYLTQVVSKTARIRIRATTEKEETLKGVIREKDTPGTAEIP